MHATALPAPSFRRAVLIVAAVSAALIYSLQSGTLVRALARAHEWPRVPYLNPFLATASDLIVMAVLLMLTARIGLGDLVRLSGVTASPRVPLRWAAWLLIPALIVCLVFAEPRSGITALDLGWLAVGNPTFEELTYRGLAVGALMRLCGWRLLPACLWPALFFGVAHLSQGADLGTTLGVVAITGLGGLFFGWLFVRWDFNLWPAILMHVGMNGLFTAFALGDDAIGGWLLNTVRGGLVIGAVLLTLRMAPPKQRRAP